MRSRPAAKKSPVTAGTRRADALRGQICAAASNLFIRRGYGSTSMQDIADALELSRPALYYYFRDKSGILEAAIREVTVEGQKRAEALARQPESHPVELVRKLVADHSEVILTHPAQFRMLDMSQAHLTGRLRTVARNAQRSLLEAFTQVIRRGIEEGCFRVTDPRVAAFALLGMCNWTAAWYQPGGRLSRREISSLLADLGVGALLRESGPRAPGGTGIEESLHQLKNGVQHLEFVLRDRASGCAAAGQVPKTRAGGKPPRKARG